LKAFWIYSNAKPPKTHDLKQLLDFCENIDSSFTKITLACTRLTDYGIQPRYPLEIDITNGDTVLALQDCEVIFDFVNGKIM
jgi:HEPN domain-containing protein